MARTDKPFAMVEAAMDAARDKPRVSVSVAAAAVVGVGAIVALILSKKVGEVLWLRPPPYLSDMQVFCPMGE